MGNRRGLPGGPGGGLCRRRPDVTSGAARGEAAADLTHHAQLSTSERAGPGDRITGARILWSVHLKRIPAPAQRNPLARPMTQPTVPTVDPSLGSARSAI